MELESWIDPKVGDSKLAFSRIAITNGIAAIPDDYLLEAFMCTKNLNDGEHCLIGALSSIINGELPTGLSRVDRVATKFQTSREIIYRIYYGVMYSHDLALIEELIADRLDKVINWGGDYSLPMALMLGKTV